MYMSAYGTLGWVLVLSPGGVVVCDSFGFSEKWRSLCLWELVTGYVGA